MINKVILMGTLGRDPEKKTFDNGGSLVNFSLATSRGYQDKAGNWQDVTAWHSISVAYERAQEIAMGYNKGDVIYVEGELEYRSYEKEGQKQTFTSIRADRIKRMRKNENDLPRPKSPEQSAQPDVDNDDLPF